MRLDIDDGPWPCYASPEMWIRVDRDISRLELLASRILNHLTAWGGRNGAGYGLEVRALMKALVELREDLYAWGPYDKVCWSEFTAKLRAYADRLNRIAKAVGVRE